MLWWPTHGKVRPMRHQVRVLIGAIVTLLALLAGAAAPAWPIGGPAGPAARARAGGGATGDKQPIFDFSDAYYRANGIDPAGLVGRRSGADGLSVISPAPDANHRNVRVTFVLPAYDTSGGTHFFTVLGDLAPTAFQSNPAGAERKEDRGRQHAVCVPDSHG